jgi:hypothetical protein
MKHALQQGRVTKQDVLALEKAMGAKVTDLLDMVDLGGLSEQQLRQQAGAEAADMIAVLRDLARVLK